jgi:acyl-coenzyme A thioesterase PaaI-like protein
MNIETHHRIDQGLCGTPARIEPGYCEVELLPGREMQADDSGLIHGGFVFGMADYAAMLAVNDPNVVLGAADVRFTKPCRLGEKLTAKARILEEKGKKRMVEVIVGSGTDTVFEGTFTCFVLEKHVLAGKE